MATATVRDLRTRFPRIRQLLEEDGEVVVTDHGKPIAVLRPLRDGKVPTPERIDYYARLASYMPRPISEADRRALDELDRGER